MKTLILTVVTFLTFGQIYGECPALVDVPDMLSTTTFTCARIYYGVGHALGVRGCNDCPLSGAFDLGDKDDYDAGPNRLFPMGSVMVKPGCTLYVFHENNYAGSYDRYDGPAIYSKVESGSNPTTPGCAKGNPSLKCRCGMKPVSCTPDDKFEVVLRCDATGAIDTIGCNYIKKIGLIFGQEMSESTSVSSTLKAELTAEFMGIFESTIGVSTTTGYDWTHSSSVSSSTLLEFEVIANAPAGLILTIEQAVGTCGDSKARTELFRIRHTDAKGNVVMTHFENSLPDQE